MKILKTITRFILLVFTLQVCAWAQATDQDYDPQKAAAERIKREVELANQLRAERLEQERQQATQEAEDKKRIRYCNKVKDSLKQYEQARARWYKLNEQGERVYLSEDEINQRKEEIKDSIAEHCQD